MYCSVIEAWEAEMGRGGRLERIHSFGPKCFVTFVLKPEIDEDINRNWLRELWWLELSQDRNELGISNVETSDYAVSVI